MSRKYHRSKKHEQAHFAIGVVCLIAVVGGLIYLVCAGSTKWWPEARACTVVGSRVVVAGIARGSMRDPVIVYRGDYRIEYEVRGKKYFTWAESGWTDPDEKFVEDNMSQLPKECPIRVQSIR